MADENVFQLRSNNLKAEAIEEGIVRQNVVNVLNIVRDIHPDYLAMMEHALCYPQKPLEITPKMEKLLTIKYSTNAKKAAKKFKAEASVQYVEEMKRCCVPIFHKHEAVISFSETERCYCFQIGTDKVFDRYGEFLIVQSDALKSRDPFHVYEALCSEVPGGYYFMAGHYDLKSHFNEIDAITVFRKPETRNFENWCRLARDVYQMDSIARKVFVPTVEFNRYREVYPLLTDISRLTESQATAIESLLNQDPLNLFMLFGPPGTGKTFTLVIAIKTIIKAFDRRRQFVRFLICAHSNMAADNIAIALINTGEFRTNQLFRAYSPRLSNKTPPRVIEPYTRKFKNKYIVPSGNFKDKIQVVISTLGYSYQLLKEFDVGSFSHIYIDEAGQARDADAMMPLFTFGVNRTRFAVAGDPNQLSPTVISNTLRKPKYNANRSILNRLYDCPEYEEFRNNPKCFVMLDYNFRSHQFISNLVSKLFYQNKIFPTFQSDCKRFEGSDILVNNMIPVVFFAVNGVEEKVDPSVKNVKEVERVCELIVTLKEKHDVKNSDIGVITPYKANVEAIATALRKRYPEITVDSVEKYQGSERNVILFSAVRTEKMGFLNDSKRLCTALSRARQLLLITGCPKLLVQDEKWKELIKCLVENNCVSPKVSDPVWQNLDLV